ncbi:MAG: DUF4388 domain-containing protein [Sumerlaeia bacterium]
MQGNLENVPLPEVLQFISMGKSIGVLTIRNGSEEITLTISKGRIINSSSIERKRRLGELLINRGLLKRSELSRLLKIQRTVESDKKLGQILTEREVVSEQTIQETLRLQLEEEIWGLFSWDTGDFQFENRPENKIGDALVRIDIEPLILEGTRRNDEWKKILHILPNDNLILKINNPGDGFERNIKLRDSEWRVLSQINGEFTIRAVVNRSNLGRFEVFMILSQFIRSGLIEIDEVKTEEGVILRQPNNAKVVEQIAKPAVLGPKASRSLFSSFMGDSSSRNAVKKGNSAQGNSFTSPIGLLSYFVNELFSRCSKLKEGKELSATLFLDQTWFDIVQVYNRADLITTRQNVVNTNMIEAYLESCQFNDLVDECFEDALEGLVNMVKACYTYCCNVVGEKNANRVVTEMFQSFDPNISLKYRGPFPLSENIKTILNLPKA